MKYFTILFIIILIFPITVNAQELERFTNSLPAFVTFASVKAVDGVLTIGVFSDEQANIDQKTLEIFKNLKAWKSESISVPVGNKTIEVIGLNSDNLNNFTGQIIWVLDAQTSLEDLKVHSNNGVFTVGIQDSKFGDYLFTTFIYENKSDDPKVERWRLTKLIANCEISPLRYAGKVLKKKYFSGKKCD